MPVRVGIVGTGAMGAVHARVLAEAVAGARVAAVCDARGDVAEAVASEAGGATVHAGGSDVVADPGVDAVVVASPADTHAELVLACLEAGKPVLCEKPLAATLEDCRRVVAAEAALGRRLVQVGFMRRFDPGYAELRRRLRAGEIGTPLLAHCVHRNAHAPGFFTSDMLITDSAVHEVDAVRWLLGEEVARVTALAPRSTRRVPGGVRDPQVVLLETDSGVLVDVEVFVNAVYGYDVRCEVVGEDGTLELAPPAAIVARRQGVAGVAVVQGFQERFAAAYVAELRAFAAAAARGTVAGPGAWDGYAAAAVAHAGVESLRAGRPVDVALDAQAPVAAGR
jgi:myo-inositol 2-dehydrogenase / D-chiro-inositol 1-dehydrogenase